MRISVSGKQLEVSQRLADRVRTSLEQSVARYFDRAIDAQIAFSKQGAGIRADVSVHAGRGLTVQTHGQAADPWQAFGEAEDKVAKRLRRHKRRLRNHHRREEAELDRWSVAHRILDEPEGAGEEAAEDAPAIIAEMTEDVLTLSVGEAVMRMDFGGQPALLFRNAAHGGLNMIYRRADGNVGWVDPDGQPAAAADAAMGVLELVGPGGVIADLEASSKKHALEQMASVAAGSLGLNSKAVFTVLVDREKLGSTGVGRGIAIPHAKMAGLEGIHGFLIRSREAVPFEAVDDEPVDLFFLLLAPESAGAEHLKALARVSRALRDRDTVKALREAAGAAAMRAVLEER